MDSLHLTEGSGLAIQFAGIFMIATLSLFTTRTVKRTSVDYWTSAWTSLVVALAMLMASLYLRPLRPYAAPLYFLGEYAFGYMFIAGAATGPTGHALRAGAFGGFRLPWACPSSWPRSHRFMATRSYFIRA